VQIQKRLAFSVAEYEGRMQRARQEMARRGLEVLLVHTPENICYLSGYQTPGYYMYQVLVLPLVEPPLLITRLIEQTNVFGFSWFENSVAYVDGQDPLELTAESLRKARLDTQRIGLETGCWFLTVNQAERLRTLLPRATWVDAAGTVEGARAVKSPAEIAHLRKVAKIASLGMQAGVDGIEVGASERRVAGAIHEAMIGAGGEHMGMPPFVSAGERTMLVHHTSYSAEPFRRGDVVFIELSACMWRYTAALLRCAFVGPVDAEIERRAYVSLDALDAAIEAVRPGATSGDVHGAWHRAVVKGGYQINKRAGYSLGLTFAPDWGEGYVLDLTEGDPTVLVPGMVFHIPSSIRMPGRQSVGVSETVLVTAGGREVLTDLDRRFFAR
jgi:Xaa-Pro aminopeptidase